MQTVLPLWRFSADEYQRMGVLGIFCEDDPVELIDGVIVQMSPIGNRHIVTVDRLNAEFNRQGARRVIVRVQSPIRLSEHSEPQPDLTVLRDRTDFYASSPAGPADVLLLIEVADSSLDYDRGAKLELYARSGIPEVWVANLVQDHIEVSREPAGGQYRQHAVYHRGASVSPQALPNVAIPIEAILS